MKFKTGCFSAKKSQEDVLRENNIKPETIESCSKFSSLIFQLSNKWDDVINSKSTIKQEIAQIKQLEQNNEVNLLEYLEYLINNKGQSEFIAPYLSISTDINHDIEEHIAQHQKSCFGVLGNADDIIN
jgi:hypothetical protein